MRMWQGWAALLALSGTAPGMSAMAHADTIIERWKTIPMPAAPDLVRADVDAAHGALLILDVYPNNCTPAQRPTCPATIAPIKSLLDQARAKGMLVVYSAGPVALNGPTLPVPELLPQPGEPTVRAYADKWLGSDLEKVLKDHGITNVIVTGTSADGAVLYTASGASLRGLKVVVPVDCLSSANPFAELYTVWHLKNTTPAVSRNVAITRSDMIGFK